MINTVRMSAPCKINLHLRVLERRQDGYHDIESVFQLISLADELSVSLDGDRTVRALCIHLAWSFPRSTRSPAPLTSSGY